MESRDKIREEIKKDLAWLVGVREHFLRNLASCDEGGWGTGGSVVVRANR